MLDDEPEEYKIVFAIGLLLIEFYPAIHREGTLKIKQKLCHPKYLLEDARNFKKCHERHVNQLVALQHNARDEQKLWCESTTRYLRMDDLQ